MTKLLIATIMYLTLSHTSLFAAGNCQLVGNSCKYVGNDSCGCTKLDDDTCAEWCAGGSGSGSTNGTTDSAPVPKTNTTTSTNTTSTTTNTSSLKTPKYCKPAGRVMTKGPGICFLLGNFMCQQNTPGTPGVNPSYYGYTSTENTKPTFKIENCRL